MYVVRISNTNIFSIKYRQSLSSTHYYKSKFQYLNDKQFLINLSDEKKQYYTGKCQRRKKFTA